MDQHWANMSEQRNGMLDAKDLRSSQSAGPQIMIHNYIEVWINMRSLPKSHPQKKVGSFSWWKRVPATARPYSSDAERMTKWLRPLEPDHPRMWPSLVATMSRQCARARFVFWTECLQNSSPGSSPKPQRLRSTSYRSLMQCYWASGQPVWLLKSRYSVKAGWKRAPEAKGLN